MSSMPVKLLLNCIDASDSLDTLIIFNLANVFSDFGLENLSVMFVEFLYDKGDEY
jgi:hypothetical protein